MFFHATTVSRTCLAFNLSANLPCLHRWRRRSGIWAGVPAVRSEGQREKRCMYIARAITLLPAEAEA